MQREQRNISAASVSMMLKIAGVMKIMCYSLFSPSCPQARQILEREYNNLLALGTDRRLDEVSREHHLQH